MNNKFKNNYILIMGLSLIIVIVIGILMDSINSKNYNIQVEKSIRAYENTAIYKKNYRKVEYIGGENIYLNHPMAMSYDEIEYVGERWYPFYRDIDTGEILRGVERYNYITAGIPFIGIDKMDVPEERKTRKGFQKYVLDWTGSILFRDLDYNSNQFTEERIYGNTKGLGLYDITAQGFHFKYDMPIDLISNYLLYCEEAIVSNVDIEKIDNIEKVKNYKYLQGDTRFSENEWILNILRNCFGHVSDDFYNIFYNNQINFNRIELDKVLIGDIGVYGDEENGYKCGICIGYDTKRNPVFSVCTSSGKAINKNINSEYTGVNFKKLYKGYNTLFVEKNNNTLFNTYYRTNIPFEDGNKYNIEDFIMNDIDKYNNLIRRDELKNRVIDERVRRIKEREMRARNVRQKNNIDLKIYRNIDITTLFLINEMDSYEYRLYAYGIEEKDKKNQKEILIRKTYEQRNDDILEKQRLGAIEFINSMEDKEFELYYNDAKEEIKERITNYKEEIKKCRDNQELKQWIYSMNGTDLEYQYIRRYLEENPNCLD